MEEFFTKVLNYSIKKCENLSCSLLVFFVNSTSKKIEKSVYYNPYFTEDKVKLHRNLQFFDCRSMPTGGLV